jgi:hypothetical protein
MSNIPLDVERRCGQRSAARFEAARALRHQHGPERQQQQQPPRITTKAKPVLAGRNLRNEARPFALPIRLSPAEPIRQ